MKLGTFLTTLGAELCAAEHLEWEISFVHAANSDYEGILKRHFPNTLISSEGIQNKNIEVWFSRTPGPPRYTAGRRPIFDTDYFELALQFFEFAKKLGTRWLVWETTPSFLRDKTGKSFAKLLLRLEELGYGFAYRVFNSKYFGVPQRRRSLFLVGYIGDWRPPAAVLFEQQSKTEYSAPNRSQPVPVRTLEEADKWRDLVLPYKVVSTNLYSDSPSLATQKKLGYPAGCPFVLVSPTRNEARFFSPVEWERLQGLPDNWTVKSELRPQPFGDCRRYEIIGNSGTVPTYLWLFNRIGIVDKIKLGDI